MSAVLVVGASGEVGRAVIGSLGRRGARVRVLVHSAPVEGVESVRGDLADPASLASALAGCDSACFVTPHHEQEAQLGFNFVDACEAAQLRRLVYVSSFHPRAGWLPLQRVVDGIIGLIGPHYRAKLAVERRVRRSSLSPVVLGPSNFYQNDELALPEILAGSYPNPMGQRRLNRVDTRDIGDAAARALVGDDVASGAYSLVGPDNMTGDDVARIWTEELGRPVVYGGDDIERWRTTIGTRMSSDLRANDFARTYRIIQRFGAPANARVLAQTTAVLGQPPRDYRSYVRELVAREKRAS